MENLQNMRNDKNFEVFSESKFSEKELLDFLDKY